MTECLIAFLNLIYLERTQTSTGEPSFGFVMLLNIKTRGQINLAHVGFIQGEQSHTASL